MREDFVAGKFKLKIEPTRFRLKDYRAFLQTHAPTIAAFKGKQQAAFEAERDRWKADGQDVLPSDSAPVQTAPDPALNLPANARCVASEVAGSVWKVDIQVGDTVTQGQSLVIVESMKMEFALLAPCSGIVTHLFCQEGGAVSAGQDLLVIGEPG